MDKSNLIEEKNIISIEFKKETKSIDVSSIFSKLESIFTPIVIIVPLYLLFCSSFDKELLSVQKLERVNKIILYDTLSADKNTALYQLQNQIHKDLLKDNEKINYNIANQELLSIDLITQEFLGSHGIAIGNTASIDIETNEKQTQIHYNNFTEEGKVVIVKQLDKNNYPKMNLKSSVKQNDDKTYTIEAIITK